MEDNPTKEHAVQAPGTKTVLAIDDEPYIQDILKIVLEAEGYTVLTASNGRESIQLYKEHWRNIHVVLLDFMMPEMTGDKVFDHLKQINPNVPVLLVSGSADLACQANMLAKGVRGVVHKPFYLTDLVQQVGSVIATTQPSPSA